MNNNGIMLNFPRLCIISAVDPTIKTASVRAVFRLENAPLDVFDGWFWEVIEKEHVKDDALLLAYRGFDKWSGKRWWALNALAEYGVDLTKYLFADPMTAQCALMDMTGGKEKRCAS